MIRIIILFLFITVAFDLMADPPEETRKFQKEISKHYGIEAITTKEIKALSNAQDIYFEIYNGANKIGIAVLSRAKGRYDKFDFMLIYTNECELSLIKVLVYRSDYGSEIMSKKWLAQFYTKKEDSLKYGRDIQAITGATFSALSLTKNVNRINKTLKEYQPEKEQDLH